MEAEKDQAVAQPQPAEAPPAKQATEQAVAAAPEQAAAAAPEQAAVTSEPEQAAAAPGSNVDDHLPGDVFTYSKDGARTRRVKRKRSVPVALLRALISIVLIAVLVFLVLWVVSIAAHYNSIPAMLRDMSGEVAGAWQRIVS